MVRTPGGPLTFRHGCRWTQAHLWLAFACGRKHIPSAVLPHPGAGVPVHKRRLVPQANPCGNALQACSEPVWGRPLPRRPRAGRWPPSPRGRHRLCLPAACGAPGFCTCGRDFCLGRADGSPVHWLAIAKHCLGYISHHNAADHTRSADENPSGGGHDKPERNPDPPEQIPFALIASPRQLDRGPRVQAAPPVPRSLSSSGHQSSPWGRNLSDYKTHDRP